MKVITLKNPGYEISERPKPQVRDDTVLIKVVAVAINPTDTKTPQGSGAPDGVYIGCDAAGIVEEVGPNPSRQFKKGDRVSGFAIANGVGKPEDGAFAEYAIMRTGAIGKTPDNLSFEEAATLGVGTVTIALSLYQSLQMPLPALDPKDRKPAGKTLLVYGGSTATGILSIQYAKLSGFDVVTTCSPRNFDLVKSLGASAAFDYNSPTAGADINKYTKNELHHAHDCIGTEESAAIVSAALSSSPDAKLFYCPVLPVKLPNREGQEIHGGFILGYTAGGEVITYRGQEQPARPQDYEASLKFWKYAEAFLASGEVKPHSPDVRSGGLEGVLQGIQDVKDGKVSGKKLVYKL